MSAQHLCPGFGPNFCPPPAMVDEVGSPAAQNVCSCFEGTCRGREVINGKLANGSRCKASVQAVVDELATADSEGGEC